MKMNRNTILITGGATGIGYAITKYFYQRDNTVIICGRREDRLMQAANALPGLHTFSCDVSTPRGREALFGHISEHFPSVNILVNNAGIQCDLDLTEGISGLPDLMQEDNEIRVNFVAPIYLSALFTPLLAGKDNAAMVNVSSGLAFMVERAARAPIYC